MHSAPADLHLLHEPSRLLGHQSSGPRSDATLLIAALGALALVLNLAGQVPASLRGRDREAAALSPAVTGPQRGITCPAGGVDLSPGVDIQHVVDAHPGRTAFCLKAGVYTITGSITPKTGDTFIGEYGAILDGTPWRTTDTTQGAFRAHNQDIDNVTIRNLVIRNMPQKGIEAYYWMSDHWTIEDNEIASNKFGLVFPNSSTIRNNYIHHNVGDPSSSTPYERGGGYHGHYASHTTFDTNEIAYNGPEQKVMESVNVIFRNNFVHHNIGDGIWYDSGNSGVLIEGNRVEDNRREGIFYEASSDAIIRNNTARRNGITGVFISTSQNVQIYNNTLEDNFRGVTYFVNCSIADKSLDLRNNSAHDNTIRVGAQSGALANGFSHTPDCTSTQVAAYLNGSKNLTFSRNSYRVPSRSERYWLWDGAKQWFQWQSLGHDLDGIIAQ
jgi:parallel beta-helix repeat protein